MRSSSLAAWRGGKARKGRGNGGTEETANCKERSVFVASLGSGTNFTAPVFPRPREPWHQRHSPLPLQFPVSSVPPFPRPFLALVGRSADAERRPVGAPKG